jgi:hypothetical protein
MSEAIKPPAPWPDHITNAEFETHVRRLFDGKSFSKSPKMVITAGPSGAGKTSYCYHLLTLPENQNTVLIDWNENMLVHLDRYKSDKASDMPMAEVYARNVQDCIFLTGLLYEAALGRADDALRKKYAVDDEKLAILRKHIEPRPYDLIICTVLGGPYNPDGIWHKSTHYERTLAMFLADFNDCKKRVTQRGGWLENPDERAAMQWYMDETVARKNFDNFYKFRDENIREMGKTGTLLFFGLPPNTAAPIQMAIKPKGQDIQISNRPLWDHFMKPPTAPQVVPPAP